IGIGYSKARSLNSGVVYASSSGWGNTGPMCKMSAVDSHLQAFSGFAALNGVEGGPPEMLRYTHIDPSGGALLAAGVLLGLVSKQRYGEGQHVITSHLSMTLLMQSTRLAEVLYTNKAIPRLGSGCTASVPNRCFVTQDGKYIAITVQKASQWVPFCKAIDMQVLESDSHFIDNSSRVANRDLLDGIIEKKIKSLPLRWWLLRFASFNIPSSQLMDSTDILSNTHIRDNHYIVTRDPPHTGKITMGGLPWMFSETPASLDIATSIPGADTSVLKALGFKTINKEQSINTDKDSTKLPLSGIKVIEFCHGYAGPQVGLLLAESGASVTKIEVGDGDWSRALSPSSSSNISVIYDALNRNKIKLQYDKIDNNISAEIGAKIADADIVLSDWNPKTEDTIASIINKYRASKLIELILSYYGEQGDLGSQEGSELTIQAMTGYLRSLGNLTGPPVRVGADIAESAASSMGFLGVLSALYSRSITNKGQSVSVSRLGAIMSLRSLQWAAISKPDEWLGPSYCLAETDPPRYGYKTADGNIFVSMMNLRNTDSFLQMLKELGMTEESERDPVFLAEGKNTIGMGYLTGKYHAFWEKHLQRFSVKEALGIFNRNGATAVEFSELNDLVNHPQIIALGLIEEHNGKRFIRAPWVGHWKKPDVFQ
ncbi:MAG: hypothetical protein CMM25_05610, partial [Rhodospirillaceae bacterium]|nr:hypothetical protein [Rhodospirillaceae bacterium]